MTTYGPRTTANNIIHTGWDAAELEKLRLQDGTTFAQVVSQLETTIRAVMFDIANGWASELVSFTGEPTTRYRTGVSNAMTRFVEGARGDPQRSEQTGHMLPLIPWNTYLEWTWRYLDNEARMEDIVDDIVDAGKRIKDRWRLSLLTRLLKRGDDSGEKDGLGDTGLSPGFATAAASTGVDFTPISVGGQTFDSDHEHYVGIAGGVYTNAVFTDARDELREHGHEPGANGYTFYIGKSDESTVKGLSDFIPVAQSNVAYGANISLSTANGGGDDNGIYAIGSIDDFTVKVVPGIPQYYGFGYKSYGSLSQLNPLRVRVPAGLSAPLIRVMPDPRSGGGNYPLQNAMLFTEFGVGVKDRTNGTARYVNNATWADGTAT